MRQKGTILLVEDTLTSISPLNGILTAEGYEVLAADSGELALASVAVTPPDLILLDLNMHRMDGREVLENIKQDQDLKKIPVVILTTSRAEEDILKSYDLHANCFISKPVDLDHFISVVKSIGDFWLTMVQLPNTRS